MNVDIQGLKNKQITFIMFSIFVISMFNIKTPPAQKLVKLIYFTLTRTGYWAQIKHFLTNFANFLRYVSVDIRTRIDLVALYLKLKYI